MAMIAGWLAAAAMQTLPAASPLAPAFGNTLTSTYPDGRTSHLWLSADGTFVGQNRKSGADGGKWTLAGGRLCIAIPASVAAMGDGWKAKAPTGEPIVVRLQKGR